MSLRDWRFSAGLSQRQLALSAKVARATLSHLERDARPPSVLVASKITEALSRALGLRLETWHIFPEVFHAPDELLDQALQEQWQ
jgi:transcriptional regulator with XRE-family HTH domain